MTHRSKLLVTLPLALALSAARCAPPAEPAEGCTGHEECGSDSDCPELCEAIARLGCAEAWGIDPNDGSCLALCTTAEPSVCPRLAAKQPTCEAIDKATECGR